MVALFFVDCSWPVWPGEPSSTGAGASGATTSSSGGSSSGAGLGGGGLGLLSGSSSSTAGSGSCGHPDGPVYASSDTTLYTLDGAPLALTAVGPFDCIANGKSGAMADIAVSWTGELWGVGGHDVYGLTVQGSTVHCAKVIPVDASSATFASLAFAPAGALGPGEVLVAGNSAGELWAIDTTTGTLTQHGVAGTVPAQDPGGHPYTAANVGQRWELSGDLVFFIGGASTVGFATARDCPSPPSTAGCSDVDTLLELDMPALATSGTQSVQKRVAGQVMKATDCPDPSPGGYGRMNGLVAPNGELYGLSDTGQLVGIDAATGGACLLQGYAPVVFSGAAAFYPTPSGCPGP
jgi:hypothetical protein